MQRRNGIVAFAALSSVLLSGASSPSSCSNSSSIGPSKGEVVGAAVGIGAAIAVGTIVLVEVHKSHHTIKGCVTAGPGGIEVQNERDKKIYALTGITANVKVGDIVQVQGNRNKDQKDSRGNGDFAVAKISRDYGPCRAATSTSTGALASNLAP